MVIMMEIVTKTVMGSYVKIITVIVEEVIMKNSEYNETEIQERAQRLPFDNVLYFIFLAFISELKELLSLLQVVLRCCDI